MIPRSALFLGAWLAVRAAFAIEHAADWPSFQGPRGDGTSPETGLLREWPKDGPPVAWRVPIGQGWGAPSVAGEDVVLAWSETKSGMSESVA